MRRRRLVRVCGSRPYGVVSFAVTARTREIGIRAALGAERASVQRLVVRTLLFDPTPTDPLTYATITVVLDVTAVLASWGPGLRASRVDPAIAWRAE
jgi:putative ABC transport system permease protein